MLGVSPFRLAIIFIAVFIALNLSSALQLPGSAVKCASGTICSPSGTSTSEACSTYKRRKRNSKIVIELDNKLEPPVYYGFCLRVDQYAQFTCLNSSDYMMRNFNESTVRIFIDEEVSDYRYHVDEESTLFVPYYTAVINLQKGLFGEKVDSSNRTRSSRIKFENQCSSNGCVLDGTYPCLRNKDCGMKISEGIKQDAKKGKDKIGSMMDVKVFIAWAGTGAPNVPLKSSGLLPSKFRAYAMSKYLNTFLNIFIPDKE